MGCFLWLQLNLLLVVLSYGSWNVNVPCPQQTAPGVSLLGVVIFSLYISSFFPLFSGRRAVYCVCGSCLIAGCSWLTEVLHVPDHSAPRALLPREKLALAEVWITQDLVMLTSVRRGSETPWLLLWFVLRVFFFSFCLPQIKLLLFLGNDRYQPFSILFKKS